MTAASPAASPAGEVRLRLTVADGRVRDVAVTVMRPATAARQFLIGKPVAEALKLAPLLFAVCGVAQQAAATAAAEQALDAAADPAHQNARALLTAGEALGGHLQHLALDWPQAAGEPPQPMLLAGARKALGRLGPALYPARDGFALGGGRLRPDIDALLTIMSAASDAVRQLTGAPPALFREPPPPTDPPLPRLLPPRDAQWFGRRLAADPAFADFPDDDGEPALNGPLADHADHPDIRQLLRHCGLSVVSLYAARLVAVAQTLDRMVRRCQALAVADPRPDPIFNGGGAGCGLAHAARGALAHWLRIEQGVVADWRAVAPTEWNFHPKGPLAAALTGMAAGPDLARRVELLACSLDPCTPWRVDVVEKESGHA